MTGPIIGLQWFTLKDTPLPLRIMCYNNEIIKGLYIRLCLIQLRDFKRMCGSVCPIWQKIPARTLPYIGIFHAVDWYLSLHDCLSFTQLFPSVFLFFSVFQKAVKSLHACNIICHGPTNCPASRWLLSACSMKKKTCKFHKLWVLLQTNLNLSIDASP